MPGRLENSCLRAQNSLDQIFQSRFRRCFLFTLCLLALLGQILLAQEISRKVLSRTLPDVPAAARRLHLVGKVKLEVVIAPSGQVTSATLLGGSPIFEQNAVKAMKQWKFEPADKESKGIIVLEFKAE
jgi:TonB family protein